MLLAYSRENLESILEKGKDGIILPQYNLYQKLSDVWRVVEDFYMTCVKDELKDDEIKAFYIGILVRLKALSTQFGRKDGESEQEYIQRVVEGKYNYTDKYCYCKVLSENTKFEPEIVIDRKKMEYGYIVVSDSSLEANGKSWKNEFWNIVRGVSVNDTWFKNTHTKFLDALNMCLDAFKFLWNSDSGKCGMMFVWDRSEIILKLKAIDNAVLEVLVNEIGSSKVKERVSVQTEINSEWQLLKD